MISYGISETMTYETFFERSQLRDESVLDASCITQIEDELSCPEPAFQNQLPQQRLGGLQSENTKPSVYLYKQGLQCPCISATNSESEYALFESFVTSFGSENPKIDVNTSHREEKSARQPAARWSELEQFFFVQSLSVFKRTQYKQISDYVQTKTEHQVQQHSEAFFQQLQDAFEGPGTVQFDSRVFESFLKPLVVKYNPAQPVDGYVTAVCGRLRRVLDSCRSDIVAQQFVDDFVAPEFVEYITRERL
ncbi:Myb-like_DNA-binding domain-containing protein [Hexamita inflata]|uniref:Myb-like DNA-binding domain-containing protein n=1 Tax=Hexamita inflata TaxID=28002 RepID=A0AA86QTQ2_9EUKA|nr:Myb-like DNA-binding domain-containing protein [Hexamita inflata]